MMDSFGYQARLDRIILDEAPDADDLSALGGDAWRWETYRRLVRNRLYQTVDHAFERLSALLGRDGFRRLVDAFLTEHGPRSPFLRDVPGELLEWFENRAREGRLDAPACALDLARLEWAELATAYAEAVMLDDVGDFAMDRPAVLSPIHRLVWLDHPVHMLDAEARCAPAMAPKPVVLCLHRDRTFDVQTLELTPITGALLREIARAPRPLVDVIRQVASDHGAVVDAPFLDALSRVFADLIERGVLLGSRPTTERDAGPRSST